MVGSSSPVLTNCVVFGNDGNNTFFNDNASVTATYSLFDNTDGVDVSGPGNLTVTVSPFVSTASVALAPCSPAIDAGDPATTSATVGVTDLAGNARFFNGGRVDMGAVEFQGQGLPVSFSVLGSGTATCAASPTITLNGSQTGVSYQLWLDGISTGTALTGTGAALSFGPKSLSGVYSVVATNTTSPGTPAGCTLVMAQSATVVNNTATPVASLSAVSLSFCAGSSLTLTASDEAGLSGLSYTFSSGATQTGGAAARRPPLPRAEFILSRWAPPTVAPAPPPCRSLLYPKPAF